MRFSFLIFGFLSTIAMAENTRPLLRYEKGEVIPVLAIALDKSGPHEYTLRLPPKVQGLSGDVLKKRLEKELRGLAGVEFNWQGSDLVLIYQGPDTPLIQTLSRIQIEAAP